MTTTSAGATPDTEVVARAPGRLIGAWAVVAVVLVAVAGAYAWARWPGALPLGSDNDEYQLVGRALAAFEAPVVAGVEGTKYPLGYPAVLAVLEWLQLPVAPAALALNLVAVAVTVGLVAWLVGRPWGPLPASPGAGLAAGAVVATSVSVWNDAYSVMPELLTLAVVAGMLAVVAGGLPPRRLLALTVLAVAAVALKTLALLLVLGGCTLLAVRAALLEHRTGWGSGQGPLATGSGREAGGGQHEVTVPLHRGWEPGKWGALAPAAAALVVAVAGMLAMRPYPDHTTGYVATFRLRDPFDASLGELGIGGLARRTIADVPETLADLGRAIAWIDAPTTWAGVVAVLGLTLGIAGALRLRRGGPLGVFVAGAVLAYVVGLSAWPYHSSRFGIPLVPVAALGAGWVVREASDRWSRGGRSMDEGVAPPGPGSPGAGLPGAGLPGAGSAGAGSAGVGSPGAVGIGTGLALGGVVLVALLVTSWTAVVDRGEAAAERLAGQHAAMAILEGWAEVELGEDDRLVSFDYREVARALDRTVWPLAYTTGAEDLWAMVAAADADYLVMVDFHHARNRQLGLLLDAWPERFQRVLDGDGVGVWRVEA